MTHLAQSPRTGLETPDPAHQATSLVLVDPVSGFPDTKSVDMDAAEYKAYLAWRRRRRAPKRVKENREYAQGVARLVTALRKRACEGDLAALGYLGELSKQVDAELLATVTELRGGRWAYSWAHVADALGMSRSAVAERFRKAGGVRPVGGQPLRWR